MRHSRSKGIQPFYVFDVNGAFIGEYQVIKRCSDDLSISGSDITMVLQGKRNSVKGYFIIKKEEFNENLLIDKVNKYKEYRKGELNSNAKITEDEARKIKELIAKGTRKRDIIETMNISESIYNGILCGYSWKHIEVKGFNDNRRIMPSRLERDVVLLIRELLENGKTQQEIADQLKLSYAIIHNIKRNKTYKNII